MRTKLLTILIILLLSFVGIQSNAQAKRAPPSRYTYVLEFDVSNLPEGVKIKGQFISNSSDIPLIISEKFDMFGRFIGGTKLKSGKVYRYYPDGIPMSGKQHLKGWQTPFDVNGTRLSLHSAPVTIYEGKKRGLSKKIPKSERFTIPAKFNNKPYEIKGMIHYKLNPAYDKAL